MFIGIEHHDKSFNIALASKEGREPFLVVKGCRIVDGSKGRFVSGPAKKMDDGKYFNYSYMSAGFQAELLKAYDASAPKASHDSDDSAPPF